MRGQVVGEGARAEPGAKPPGQCRRSMEYQPFGTENRAVARTVEVQVDQRRGIRVDDEVFGVANAFGAELWSRTAQDHPVALRRSVGQREAHDGRRLRDLVDGDQL